MSAVADVSSDVSLDAGRQALARRYARERRRIWLADLGLSALLVVGFLVSGASAWLRDTLVAAGLGPAWALVGAYAALAYVGYVLLLIPLGWYSGLVLPHRYGLSTQTPRSWLLDQLKSLALGLALVVPAAMALYGLLGLFPDTWWLWGGALLLAASALLYYVAPVLIVPLFYRLTPLDDPGLVERIRRLAGRTGRRIAGVYTIDLSSRTRAANALFMGLGPTKRIALGDTLYAEYAEEEIEAIVAHELGHQVHHDLPLALALQGALLVGALYLAHVTLRWGVAAMGLAGPGDVAALPLLVLAAGTFSMVTLPLANAHSRWRERLADRFAIEATGNGRAFARAMTRLANQNLAEADPPRWVVWLLYTHPPLAERITLGNQAVA